jgi:pyruvate dehydrogenase E2 component (dihydrolipoamide acetyltransferase)
MPQLGETVTEGTIIRWLKQVGDPVALDEPLFEVSTDKVDSEVPSPFAGILSEIIVQEGETVEVGTRLAEIAAAGQPAGAPPSPEPEAAPTALSIDGAAAPAYGAVPPPPAPEPTFEPASPISTPSSLEPAFDAVPPPPASEPTFEPPPSISTLPPTEPVFESPPPPPETPRVEEPTPVAAQATEVVQDGRTWRASVLSPVVRKLIRDNDLDPGRIPGTGAGGRITRDDVLGYLTSAATTTAVASQAAPSPSAPAYAPPPPQAAPARPAVATPPAPVGVRDEIVPFSAVRRITAEHMVRSIQTSVHTMVAMEADFENVERVRAQLKEQFRIEEGIGLSYLPFVARAVIDVLRDYPNLNSSVGDDALIVHHDIHLGIAVDLQREGLIVPVIHNADGQSLRGIARSIADLANRARDKKLSADDITGGTFTITNPGPFGTFITSPIIAQPQVAILSTDGVKRKPVVMTAPDGTESIGIHSVGVLALVFDHRAVDGAYASAFVRDVASVIETRDWHAEL